MSLLKSLTNRPPVNVADYRRYADLLRANDQRSLPELKELMFKLGKTIEDVKSDQQTINNVIQLQAQIGGGTNVEYQLAPLWEQIQQHESETKRILEERQAAVRKIYEQRSGLISQKEVAERAIEQINQLKTINPELLSDITVPKIAELG